MENAEYLVYEIVERERHIIAYCDQYADAKAIAVALATVDPKCDEYFVTVVERGNVFTPGGGWFDAFRKDAKTGLVEERNLG